LPTDRPDDPDATNQWGENTEAGGDWFFAPQSDQEAGLTYLGEAPKQEDPPAPASPAAPRPDAPASPKTPADPTAVRAAAPQAASGFPASAAARSAASTASRPGTPRPAAGAPGVAARPGPAGTPLSSPSPSRPAGAGHGPGRGVGTGVGIAVGIGVGTLVLLLAWYFLIREPGTDAARATPVRSTASVATPSATPTPTPARTRTSSITRPTSATATPTLSSSTPSATASPSVTGGLNDPANRLGWTFIIDGLGPVKLGLSATEAVELGVLQAVPSACDAHSPTALLGGVSVHSTGGRGTAVDIRSAAFPSGRGVRVGTPLANLQAIYGETLKPTVMTDGGTAVNQWALTSGSQYIAYLVDGSGTVNRIAIGYRGTDGSITLPPPC